MNSEKPIASNKITLPAIPALYALGQNATMLTTDGEIKTIPTSQAASTIHKQPVLVCHAPYTRQRLHQADFIAFDVLELFAFVHPATFCVPTPHGLCAILNLPSPASTDDIPLALMDIARMLLEHIQFDQYEAKAPAADIASVMGLQGKGWVWTPFVLAALGQDYDPKTPINSTSGLNIWKHLPEWEDAAPRPPADHFPVSTEEALTRLSDLLQSGGDKGLHKAEPRPQQKDYAAHITRAFDTPDNDGHPHIVLAEAGTGTGKTLGYLAPASVWAEKNQGTVWVSTYTKNLQRQINRELDRLYPHQTEKEDKIAVRKGRENYLCLLNLSDAAAAAATAYNPTQAIAAGIMARWAAATSNGDLTGAEFPGWLGGLLGFSNTLGLADRRGECIYSACDHYKKCFTEHSTRAAKSANIVIANHALVMIQSALASPLETLPTRYIFDEGHHLFDAADSAFAAHLTAQETRDLRRWILGHEGGNRGRARGLKKRAEDLCAGDSEAETMLRKIISAAEALPTDSWTRRLKNAQPSGEAEEFFHVLYQQINARSIDQHTSYSIETNVYPIAPEVLPKAAALHKALKTLQKPMQALAKHFIEKLQDHDKTLEADTKKRLEAIAHTIDRRASLTLQAWIDMLQSLQEDRHSGEGRNLASENNKAPASAGATKDYSKEKSFVDWLEITRQGGHAVDIGFFRHWIDPMQPFTRSIAPHLHGAAITSATLRDQDDDNHWDNALRRTGSQYLTPTPQHLSVASPFDYAQQTRIIIINDVNKNSLHDVANAYLQLFRASGGGALGLFTAINRLRAVHNEINAPLAADNINLHAQHVDDIDIGTLIDMFRFDPHSCMLGTDAARDGVDVPGESLRMLVFDRVPWPRPTILHKARRDHFGQLAPSDPSSGGKRSARSYDEMLTRLKIKQAFGRLVRKADDKGVFVMLDGAMPSRLQTAFPEGVEVIKCGLSNACTIIQDFLNNDT